MLIVLLSIISITGISESADYNCSGSRLLSIQLPLEAVVLVLLLAHLPFVIQKCCDGQPRSRVEPESSRKKAAYWYYYY